MVCDKCGCKIKGEPAKCPLCDNVFNEEKTVVKKPKRVSTYKKPFTLIYFLTTVALACLVFVTCEILDWNRTAFWCSVYALFPLYYIVRHTILGMRNPASKITGLSFIIALFNIALLETSEIYSGYYYMFTTYQVVMFVITAILILSDFKAYYPYISCFLNYAVISWIPFVFSYLRYTKFIYPLVVAIIENIFTLYFVIRYPKEIWNQVKRLLAL